MRSYCQLSVVFAAWCRDEHGLRRLGDVTPEMTADFIADLRRRGRSPATVNTYVCAIKKLDAGLRQVGWRYPEAAPLVGEFHGRRADVVADPYSPEDAERLIRVLTAIDPQYGGVARLQRMSGLRVSEAVHLQAGGIAADGSQITLAGPGTHAKGGRPRQVPILAEHQPVVAGFLEQGLAHADGHVFQQRQSLSKAVKLEASRQVIKLGIEAGDGTHSFRKLYANELYQHLLTVEGRPDDEARRAVTQALGHNRLDVLKAYISGQRRPQR
ncbi:MAG: integrase domain-containing protein [Anaerolineales bacterium]|nr:integrase domain-containing protein [Anaerolineales bacterium]